MCKPKPFDNSSNTLFTHFFKKLRLLSYNVENLEPKLEEPHFLDLVNKHDLCILCETWKKDESKLDIPGWWDFSQIRPKTKKTGRHSGGITVLAKQEIRKGIKVILSTEGFLWIKLNKVFFSMERDLFVCGAYIPPERSINSVGHIDFFEKLIEQVSSFRDKGNVLLAGDFNARIGSDKSNDPIPCLNNLMPDQPSSNSQRSSCDHTVNNYGKKIIRVCNSFNLKVVNGQAAGDLLGNYTCFNYNGSSVVDLIITDNIFFTYIDSLRVLTPEFNSSHAPLSVDIRCKPKVFIDREDINLCNLPSKLIWDNSKKDELLKLFEISEVQTKLNTINNNLSNVNINNLALEEALDELCNILVTTSSNCMKLSTRAKKKKRVSTKPKSKKWYDSECYKLKKRFKSAAKLLQSQPSNPFARGNFMHLKKEYRSLLKKKKMVYETDIIAQLEKLSDNPKAFWNHVKSLKSISSASHASSAVSADSWVDHFTKLNKQNPSAISDNIQVQTVKSELQTLLRDITKCDILDREFTVSEIESGIKKTKAGKATALDIVSNELLKATSKFIAPIITNLFNRILSSENIPDAWGLGIIVPIFKAGEQDDPDNYRGISINSCISKLFTLLLNNRLTNFTDNNNSIHFNQLGFRRDYRTADHVFTLKTIVDNTLTAKRDLYVCFVDFKKAFDTVWRDGLLLKLLRSRVSTKFVRLLKNMYNSLKCCVRLPLGLSQPFPSLTGLRQGCNLSPILFNLFINDLVDSCNSIISDSPMLNNIKISCLLYADDLILISESKDGLQNLLDGLNSFSQQWFLAVNTKKTKTLVFSRKRNKPSTQFYLGENQLPSCDSYCYLGCMFSQNGSFKFAAQTLYEKATKSMYGLLNTIYKYKSCTINTMLKLFDHLVVPIALYNCEVWGPLCFSKNSNQLNLFSDIKDSPDSKIQYQFLKYILGVGKRASHFAALSETGCHPLRGRVMTSMLRFWLHLFTTPNPLLSASLHTNVMLSSKQNTWFSQVNKLMKFLNIDHILYTTDFNEITYQIGKCKKLIKTKFVEYWDSVKSELKTKGGKLDFYLSFKESLCCEPYLNLINIPKIRHSISKFRIGAHKLPVETGRYRNIERNQRTCPHCNSGVGDEGHYLFQCDNPFLLELRTSYFQDIALISPPFNKLPDNDKLLFLMQNKNHDIMKRTGTFFVKLQDFFKETIA